MESMELWQRAMDVAGIQGSREIRLPKYYSFQIDNDIKHLNFVFSRYKFAAKMIEPRETANILELGCNHGIGTQFLSQAVNGKVLGIDFDHEAIKWAEETFSSNNVSFLEEDFLGGDYRNRFKNNKIDAIVSIDVIEHIEREKEQAFMQTLDDNLSNDGMAVIGTPNIAMQQYASSGSQIGHVNLFDQKRLHSLLSTLFQNVFIFGMTDEVVHTGYYPMCCYIMAVCAGKK